MAAIGRTQADGDAVLSHNEANPVAGVKLQASNNQSFNDRRVAMILAAKRRDEAAKSAGSDR